MFLPCCKVPSLSSSWIMYVYLSYKFKETKSKFSHGRYLSLQPNICCNSPEEVLHLLITKLRGEAKLLPLLHILIYFVFTRHNPIIIFKGTSSNTTIWRWNPNKNLEGHSDTNQEKKILIRDSKSRKGLDAIYSNKFVWYLFSLVSKDCLNP